HRPGHLTRTSYVDVRALGSRFVPRRSPGSDAIRAVRPTAQMVDHIGGSGARQNSSAEKGWPGMLDRLFADRVQLPVAGDALERMDAPVAEWDARAGYEVGDGAGDEYLAGLRRGR